MICKECGYEIPNDSAFCNKCGSRVFYDFSIGQNVQPEEECNLDIVKSESVKVAKHISPGRIVALFLLLIFLFFVGRDIYRQKVVQEKMISCINAGDYSSVGIIYYNDYDITLTPMLYLWEGQTTYSLLVYASDVERILAKAYHGNHEDIGNMKADWEHLGYHLDENATQNLERLWEIYDTSEDWEKEIIEQESNMLPIDVRLF